MVLKFTSIVLKCSIAHLILCFSEGLKFSRFSTNFVSLTKYSLSLVFPWRSFSSKIIAQSGLYSPTGVSTINQLGSLTKFFT